MKKYTEPRNPIGTVSELFAGVGGFRIGLAASKWKTTFSNQWEPSTTAQPASEVYVKHFGDKGHYNEDIFEVLNKLESGQIKIEPTDMLVGGFPCQDYSVAKSLNSAKGLEGKKGVLWWQILRLIEINKPSIVFLENVDRLLKSPASQRGRDFAIMLASLSEKYFVEWRVVNAADYGFAQKRRRVFIVAKRIDKFTAPEPSERKNWIINSGTLARALQVEDDLITANFVEFPLEGELDVISETFDLGGARSPFLSAGIMVNRQVITCQVTPKKKKPQTLRSVLTNKPIPDEFFVDNPGPWSDLKAGGSVERTHASGFKYNYSEGSMAFPDNLDGPARTITTGEGGRTPSRFKHIIEYAPGKHRRLVPEELERLNGFEPGWTEFGLRQGEKIKISDTKRAFFMGNALVIGIVKLIGAELAKDWENLKLLESKRELESKLEESRMGIE